MTTPLRRRLRRGRRLLAYGVATLLILAALIVAVANQMLPLLSRHPEKAAAWLSERIGRPVTLREVDARWNRRGPLLRVKGLRIGAAEDGLELERAELQINAYAGFLPGVPLTVLRLERPELDLTRSLDGRWRLEGVSGGGAFDLRQLDGIGELQIDNAQLRIHELESGREWSLQRIDARLRTVGARFRLGVSAHTDESTPLQVVADFDDELRSGEVWIGGEALSLSPWLGGTPIAGIEIVQASGNLGVWVSLRDRVVQQVRLEAALAPVMLRGALPIEMPADGDAPALQIEPRYGLDRLDAALRWQRSDAGWTLDVAHLELDGGDARTAIERLRIERGARLSLNAPEIEIGPLLSVAMLADVAAPGLRRWLYQASPRGRVGNIALDWRAADDYRASAYFDGIAWRPVGRTPALQGAVGTYEGDARAASIALDSPSLRIDVDGVLRAPMTQAVTGRVNLFATDPGWRIEAAGLQVRGADYAFALDGGIELQGDGSKPLLDLRAAVEPGAITAAKQFWIVNKMPPKAIQWLDDALIDGRLASGTAMVRGDADDWPFRNGEGRFEAQAQLDDVQLRYRHDWPVGEDVEGIARFVNDAIELDLSGTVLGNRIEHARGGIATLRDPILALDVAGGGSGPDLLALLRASPLQHRYGPYLTGLEVGGEGAVALRLDIPLKESLGKPRVEGHVDLQRADLHDAKWDLAFAGASGRVRFSDAGFSADELNVGFAGGLGTLSIAVGNYTSDEARVAEATLRGRFAVDALLQPYAALHWLQPVTEGESDWTIQLEVPRSDDADALRQLRVRSDLVGTAFTLPAPLRKGGEDRLALDLRVDLPLAAGEIDLRLGELLRLRGRLPENSGFAGVAVFGDAPDEPIPTNGIVAVGQVPVLDAAGWAAFAMAGEGGNAGVQRVDLRAGELDVLDRAFAETRLTFAREADGALAIAFEGQSLQGTLQIPVNDLISRGITARFERLHWPSQAPQGKSAIADANPALVPPLHLAIADFRFGEADLGKAQLETYPTPEGMHVERFDTTSNALEMRARGDWTRIDARERSNFRIDFSAGDLGGMLRALGFSELIEGGKTVAQLQATWPGSPSAFELQHVEGTLSAEVGKGRVLEVEPGAGRLFGLLSLTEIPRRLALDFSDFFKSGLAFNQITGSFTLDGGNAYTDDLRINGPAAEIRVRGRTGLKLKDYDQTMEVLPRAGSMLPAIGALAGGPAGAALGAVAQAMLQKPIKQTLRTLYRVQGSWSEPDIDVIERGPAAAGSASDSDAARGRVP